MIYLNNILNSLNKSEIKAIAKKELQQIDSASLPLQKGLSFSSAVGDNPINFVILKIEENDEFVLIKSGIFYTGIIAGCSCSDDPTPLDEQNEYCEVLFSINKLSAETSVKLLTNQDNSSA